MKSLLLYVLFFVALVPVALAQSITSFSPADGTENVPLNTTVSITFDTPIPASVEPQDIGFIMEPVTLIFPEEEFDVADVAISTDRLTVTLTVNLTADTDYHFAFLGLPGDGFAIPLVQAYTTSFTTRTFTGTHSISGTIDYAMAAFDSDDDWDEGDWDEQTAEKLLNYSRQHFSTAQNNATVEHRTARHRHAFQNTSEETLIPALSIQSVIQRTQQPRQTRSTSLHKTAINTSRISELPDDEDLRRRTVVLVTDIPVDFFDDDDDYWDEEEPIIFSITTVDALTGSYTAGRLNNGTYIVTALYLDNEFLEDEESESGLVGFGVYADEDEEPLPVTIDGASVTDIDFTVFVFDLNFFGSPESTGLTIYEDVMQNVRAAYPDAELYVVQGTEYWEGTPFSSTFTPNGRSSGWLYLLYDEVAETEIMALSIINNIIVVPTGDTNGFTFDPLPDLAEASMIDSDEAVMIALQNGAQQLIMENSGDFTEWEVYYRLSRDTAYALDFDVAIETANPFWLIEFQYFAFDGDDEDIASVTGFYAIDAMTGVFLQEVIVTSIDDGETTSLPTAASLMQNYPNPFNPTTSIAFTLPSHSDVRLSVYDITGREIMVLVNGSMPAGSHTVPFNAAGSLASGVYVYRLQAGGEVFTKKMTLIK